MDIAAFRHRFDAVISGVALPFNLGLMYLILKHGSQHLRDYKWVLLAICLSDVALNLVVFVSHPATLAKDGYIMLVANGWFANNNALYDHVSVALYCSMLHTNIVCIVVQFVHRYRLICGSHNLRPPSCKILVFPAVWCVLQAADAVWCFVIGGSNDGQVIALGLLRDMGWHYDADRPPYPSVAHSAELRTRVHHVIYLITCVGGYSTIVWCQWRIRSYLKQYGTRMDENTSRMHAEVNRALLVFAVAPLLAASGPTITLAWLIAFDQRTSSVAEFITIGGLLSTLINPIATIYFVRPFRTAVTSRLNFKRSAQVSAGTQEPAL